MGVIINIDEALKLHAQYNILREPLNDMIRSQQEAFESKNPIDLLFVRNTLDSFQETYTSSIGFAHAFAETSDYAVGPIFNTANGFTATYRTRTFQGSFIITKQVLEDRKFGTIKDDASAFLRRWNGEIVEYAMAALSSGFGKEVTWGSESENGAESRLKLMSADTVDGDVNNAIKNPLFTKNHTIVKRGNEKVLKQSNLFYADIDIKANPAQSIPSLAYLINEVTTIMDNYRDDNGKRVMTHGAKTIVAPNDAMLTAALNTALSMEMFNDMTGVGGINPAYKKATIETTPYLLDIPQCKDGLGFFIVDKAYNAANHGLEFTERIPLTLEVIEQKRPYGIIYDGRQRFDINVASWRGIAYVHIGKVDAQDYWTNEDFQEVKVTSIAKPVTIVGKVTTETAGA